MSDSLCEVEVGKEEEVERKGLLKVEAEKVERKGLLKRPREANLGPRKVPE